MLPIGLGKSNLGSRSLALDCLYCNTKLSLSVTVYGRYFSLVWVPVFPIGRKVVSTCSHCRQVLEKDEFIRRYGENQYNYFKTSFKTPKWHYSWLFIWIVVTPFVAYFDIQNKKEDISFIQSPAVKDLYEIKLGFRDYTLYKVARFTKDSIYFYQNKYSVSKQRKLGDDDMLKNASFDFENPIGFTKKEITDMRESKKILEIERN